MEPSRKAQPCWSGLAITGVVGPGGGGSSWSFFGGGGELGGENVVSDELSSESLSLWNSVSVSSVSVSSVAWAMSSLVFGIDFLCGRGAGVIGVIGGEGCGFGRFAASRYISVQALLSEFRAGIVVGSLGSQRSISFVLRLF